MEALATGARTVDEAVRLVRALGRHRYVAGRLHLVHAFAFASLAPADALGEAQAWARRALAGGALDIASRDERLWRLSSDEDVALVIEGFLSPASAPPARGRLVEWLERAELPLPSAEPFDEAAEEDTHPVLVDAGWELFPLAALDPERHKGAIQAFGEPILYESAKFEEAEAIPTPAHLQELPALGPVELLRGTSDTGMLVSELVLWVEGNMTYHDYVLRGVRRAAKLGE
jgi:hypothetical protein